jgi:hydrogenase maturation protease
MSPPAERERGGGTKSALLVIGYGNELRSDDGVGPKTAAAVEEWKLPGVRTLICHQLTPELSVPIAAAECVVFVDASVNKDGAVELTKLAPAGPGEVMAHAAHPRFLLKLANDIFGRSPMAFWLTIPVDDLSFGQNLSAHGRAGVEKALEKIRELLGVQAQ